MGEIKRLQFLNSCVIGALLFAICGAISNAAQPAQRIRGGIDEGTRFLLQGNVRPSIAHAQSQRSVSTSLPLGQMSIHFALSASQKADLLQLLQLQQTRHSSQYHKWLTPEQYADRFGVNQKDIQKVTAWLESLGFTQVEAARSRNVITFNGSAAQAENAFHANISRYSVNGQTHYANATAPEMPRALYGLVESVRGLNDFHPKPHARPRPRFTSNISGNHFLTPDDFATMYNLKGLYGSGIDGTGRTIAIAGQTDVDLTDIRAFRTAAGLAANDPQIVLTGTDPGTNSDDLGEADLDIEWAGGLAKNATIVYVNSTDVFTSMQYAITNNVADVLALTYGLCEASAGAGEISSLNTLFQQASAEGMTVTAASGDDGAADCDVGDGKTTVTSATHGLAVDFPASSPNVTGIGGTTLSEGSGTYWSDANNTNSGSALSYIPEVVWNDSSSSSGFAASGGGASTFNSKPSWQVGTGVPSDNARHVPDLALPASANHDGYLICSAGSCVTGFRAADTTLNVSGGTSAGSPGFAAIVALLVQQTGTRQGNVNPNLYTLASISTDAFHDITSGNNSVTCTAATTNCGTSGTLGYSAGTGYDQATGLGSVDAGHMLSEWGWDFTSSASPTSINLARGGSGTSTVTVTETNFSGNVSFTCSVASALANVTCSIPGTVNGSGTTTLTITAGATATTPWWRNLPSIPINGLYLTAALALGALLLIRNSRPALAASFALLLMIGLAGCGSGSSSTTTSTSSTVLPASETGVVTVVATSGVITSTSTLSVTVQ